MKRLAQFNLNRIVTTKGFTNNDGDFGYGKTDTSWTNAQGVTIQRYIAPDGIAVAIFDGSGTEVGRYYVSQNGQRNQEGIDQFLATLQQYL